MAEPLQVLNRRVKIRGTNTDDPTIGEGGGGGGGSAFDFSTEESKVGKWINGSDLYRITVMINTANFSYVSGVSNSYEAMHNIANIDKAISAEAFYHSTSGSFVPLPCADPDDGEIIATIKSISQSHITLNGGLMLESWLGGEFTPTKDVYFTIYYTKTE